MDRVSDPWRGSDASRDRGVSAVGGIPACPQPRGSRLIGRGRPPGRPPDERGAGEQNQPASIARPEGQDHAGRCPTPATDPRFITAMNTSNCVAAPARPRLARISAGTNATIRRPGSTLVRPRISGPARPAEAARDQGSRGEEGGGARQEERAQRRKRPGTVAPDADGEGTDGSARKGKAGLEPRQPRWVPALTLDEIDRERQLEESERPVDREAQREQAEGVRPPQAEPEPPEEPPDRRGPPGARAPPPRRREQGVARRLAHEEDRQARHDAGGEEAGGAEPEPTGCEQPAEQARAEAGADDEARPRAGAHPAELPLRNVVHDHAVAGGVEQGGEEAVGEEDEAEGGQRTLVRHQQKPGERQVASENRQHAPGAAPAHREPARPIDQGSPQEGLDGPGQAGDGEVEADLGARHALRRQVVGEGGQREAGDQPLVQVGREEHAVAGAGVVKGRQAAEDPSRRFAPDGAPGLRGRPYRSIVCASHVRRHIIAHASAPSLPPRPYDRFPPSRSGGVRSGRNAAADSVSPASRAGRREARPAPGLRIVTGGWTVTEPGAATAIQVWRIDLALSGSRLARCAAWLSAEETARADRFMRAEDRARYRASHAALRLILSRALGVAAETIAFSPGPTGKPELSGPHAGALRFNLSHSGARALIGVSRIAAIGVDVEAIRPIPDALRVARAHFAPIEAEALAALPSDAVEEAFFGLWTRKEAVVKALGAGLALPLDRFALTLPPEPPRLTAIDGGDARTWTLHHLDPGPGTVGTAAIRAPDAAIARCALPEDWADRGPR